MFLFMADVSDVLVLAVCHGSDLPDGGGRVPADQLLQLQLLVLRGFVHRWADLLALERSGQTAASEGDELHVILTLQGGSVGTSAGILL